VTKINTTRFGPVQIGADDVIDFPEGVLGLPSCREWVLLADMQNESLAWMQSVDRPEIALGVVSPRRFVPGYQMRVARRELEPLKLDEVCAAEVLIVVSRTERSITLNLKAPLVINLTRRLGRQVVTNGDYPVQYVLGSVSPALKRSA
jgi:flagellar assembly factor FliW